MFNPYYYEIKENVLRHSCYYYAVKKKNWYSYDRYRRLLKYVSNSK